MLLTDCAICFEATALLSSRSILGHRIIQLCLTNSPERGLVRACARRQRTAAQGGSICRYQGHCAVPRLPGLCARPPHTSTSITVYLVLFTVFSTRIRAIACSTSNLLAVQRHKYCLLYKYFDLKHLPQEFGAFPRTDLLPPKYKCSQLAAF